MTFVLQRLPILLSLLPNFPGGCSHYLLPTVRAQLEPWYNIPGFKLGPDSRENIVTSQYTSTEGSGVIRLTDAISTKISHTGSFLFAHFFEFFSPFLFLLFRHVVWHGKWLLGRFNIPGIVIHG